MQNLAYFLTRTASRSGDQPAILFGDRTHDYAWFNEQVSRVASSLVALGLEPGDRVGLVVENEPRGLISMMAILRAGMVMVPLNAKLHPREQVFILSDCEARAVIVSKAFVASLCDLRDELPDEIRMIVMDAADQAGTLDFDALAAAGRPKFPDAPTTLDDLAWIFYTSGTTGKPKGAMLTHRNLLTMVNNHLIELNPVRQSDRVGYVAPLSHGNGLLAFQHIAKGAAHVFPDFKTFRHDRFFAFVERHRVTTVFMVPTMIERILEGDGARHDLSSLHTVIYGGAPMYVERLRQAVQKFGPIFVQLFAQAEAPMSCTWLSKADHVTEGGAMVARLGSAGRECHLTQVRVFDESGNACEAGEHGEIVVRGDLVMRGYWNQPDATAATIRDGWLHTGDVGYLDSDGYLFITDRNRDMVITGGSNVYPREIEEVLYRHDAIKEAAVFGIPDPHWGERVVAAVVLHNDVQVSEAQLIDYCCDHLARFKKPSQICFVKNLPKSGYGKILKRAIREQLFPE